MNRRDERGWRIPRRGTKNEQIYDLLVSGFSNKEIIEMFGDKSTSVLIHNIKNPKKHNARETAYYRRNRVKLNEKARARARRYSGRVIKLVTGLGISYTEAIEIERQELESTK